MSTSKNAKPRTLLIILALTTLIGSTLYAAILGADMWSVSPFLSILMMIFCSAKIFGAGLMVKGRKIGWLGYAASAVGFALSWFIAAYMQVSAFRAQLDAMPEAQRELMSKKTLTPLGSSPVMGLIFLLVLAGLWIFLYRTQRRHFVH
jgi:hypothetical protein